MGHEGQVDPIGAGARLQAAREAVGWTREQVALKLRLSLSQVTALETGEHAGLPPAAYVRGYLRNYAQLLGLDPREVTITVKPTIPPRPAPRAPLAERWVPVIWGPVLYGLLLVIVALLGFWSHSDHQSVPTVAVRHIPSRRSVNAGLPPRLISLARPGTTSGQLSRFPLVTARGHRPHTAAPVRLSPRRSRRTSGVGRILKPAPTHAGAAPTVIVAAPPPPTPRPSATPLVALAPPPTIDTVPNPGGLVSLPQGRRYSTLTIAATTGRCWVSVHDAGGQRLAFRLIHRGQALRLVGVAPFRVSFGKPQGIRVDINGHPVPLPPARKGQVLRMTVRSQPG